MKHVRIEVVTPLVMRNLFFWKVMTCSPLKVNRRFGGTCLYLQALLYHLHFVDVFFLAYSSTLEIVATSSFETSVDFQRNTSRYIPEDEKHFETKHSYLSNTYFWAFIRQRCRVLKL
jgi:hypothetical protein